MTGDTQTQGENGFESTGGVGASVQKPAANEEEPAANEEEVADLSEDDIFHVLQTSRRRDALRYLQGADDPVRMRDLAEQVAAWEHDTTLAKLTSKERQRVYIALYQSHLPKLDKLGVIDYNQSRGIVERTPAADQFSPYLDSYVASTEGSTAASAVTEPDASGRSWPAYNLAAVTASTLLLGGTTLAGATFVPPAAVAAVILGLFALVTAGQLYVER